VKESKARNINKLVFARTINVTIMLSFDDVAVVWQQAVLVVLINIPSGVT
jgi:hypothetical protein